MPKIRLLSVKQIKLNTSRFAHAKLPDCGFAVVLSYEKPMQAMLDDKKALKALEQQAEASYKSYLRQTAKRLQKFEKLFAGMLNKSAPPVAVAKQATALKHAMEKETPKWEKAAARDAQNLLLKLAKAKR